MNFLRHLRSAWQYLRYTPYVDYADHEDFWTDEDSAAHSRYWNSPTGQKLRTRCNNLVTQSAVNSTQHTHNVVYRNGWASGVAATFTWLDGHLAKPKPEKKLPNGTLSEREAEELIERYAP